MIYEKVERWRAGLPILWRLIRASCPVWASYVFAAGAGTLFSVYVGWVDPGDGVKAYLAVLGAIVASTASFVLGRVLNDNEDRKATRRRINAALVCLQNLRAALGHFSNLMDDIGTEASKRGYTDDEIEKINSSVIVTATVAREAADFNEIIDSEEDRTRVLQVKLVYVSVLRYPTDVPGNLPEMRDRIGKILAKNTQVHRRRYLNILDNAITHFQGRLTQI
jgi:hypothetical protein